MTAPVGPLCLHVGDGPRCGAARGRWRVAWGTALECPIGWSAGARPPTLGPPPRRSRRPPVVRSGPSPKPHRAARPAPWWRQLLVGGLAAVVPGPGREVLYQRAKTVPQLFVIGDLPRCAVDHGTGVARTARRGCGQLARGGGAACYVRWETASWLLRSRKQVPFGSGHVRCDPDRSRRGLAVVLPRWVTVVR
jgi:hypothetical protein